MRDIKSGLKKIVAILLLCASGYAVTQVETNQNVESFNEQVKYNEVMYKPAELKYNLENNKVKTKYDSINIKNKELLLDKRKRKAYQREF